MRRLRDFASIADFFSAREIDELQAAIDVRREARAGRLPDDDPPAALMPPTEAAGPDNPGSNPPRRGGVV